MHALRHVSADLPDLRRHAPGTQQPPGTHRIDARHRRRTPGSHARLRGRDVLLPRLPRVRNRLPRQGWTTRICSRSRARRRNARRSWTARAAPCCAASCCAACSRGHGCCARWGGCCGFYQATGAQRIFRALKLGSLLPGNLRGLESQTPVAERRFSCDLIRPAEQPAAEGSARYRVGLLTGCVQDIVLAGVNRDTADVLLANGCAVVTPSVQPCCGSLHAHNGDLDTAAALARRQLDLFDLSGLDAIITNAAGCGSPPEDLRPAAGG